MDLEIFIAIVSFYKIGLHLLIFLNGHKIVVHIVNRGWLFQGVG